MAEKKKTEENAPSGRRTWSSTKILDCLAYFAVVFIAIALVLRLIFKDHNGQLEQAFASIGECLAYIICLWLAFYWTMRKCHGNWNKHNIWWLVGWIVAAVVIVVIYIFAIIK